MNITNSPVIATGKTLPQGIFENGKLFLKVDGVNDGLYVQYEGQWRKFAKLQAVEQPTLVEVTPTNTFTEVINPLEITIGGRF